MRSRLLELAACGSIILGLTAFSTSDTERFNGATIQTTVQNGLVSAWTITCDIRPGFSIDVMRIPQSAWTDPLVDEMERLVRTFERSNGIQLLSSRNIDPKTKKVTAGTLQTRSTGTTNAAELCHFLGQFR
jgi:hypothetical protein